MRAYRNLIVVFICFLLEASAFCEDGCSANSEHKLFQDGNNFYGAGQWLEAVDCYKKLLNCGESASLHFNIANAYARLNEVGYARFHFEKALRLNPQFVQARENLNSIATIADESFLTKIFSYLRLDTWMYMISISFWVSVVLLAVAIFKLFDRRRVIASMVLSSTVFVCAALVVALNLNKLSQAVILRATQVKFAPTDQSPARDSVSAGAICKVVDISKDFTYVSIKDKNISVEGWVKSDQLGVL